MSVNVPLYSVQYKAADLPEHSIAGVAAVPAGMRCSESWISLPPNETGYQVLKLSLLELIFT